MAESECDGASYSVSNPNHHSVSSDCISSLPDVILQHILSYNRTKFAIRTSVLSKRWNHVWSKTPSLLIDCFGVDPKALTKTLISNYTAPKITRFVLIIVDNDKITSSDIDSWIEIAMSRNAEDLVLNLMFQLSNFPDSLNYKFRDSFFVNSSVKHLDLTYYDMTPTCIVSWTKLRRLSLSSCKLSDESFANILAGCSMLEYLMLSSCVGLHHLDLSKSVNMRRLVMMSSCDGIYRLDLSKAINLRRLEIFGSKGPVEIVAPHVLYLHLSNLTTLVDVSSLTEANLNLYSSESGFSEFDFLQDMLVKMLAKFQNIEKLTIRAFSLQILSLAELRGVTIPQFKIKELVVETMIVRSIIPGITRLLQKSLGLKKITVHAMKCCTIPDTRLDEYLTWKGLDPEQCWRSEYGIFPTSEEETKDAKSSKHEALFKNLLKGNTKTLETMVIQPCETEFEKFFKMIHTLF